MSETRGTYFLTILEARSPRSKLILGETSLSGLSPSMTFVRRAGGDRADVSPLLIRTEVLLG